jgi:hypothetical protein
MEGADAKASNPRGWASGHCLRLLVLPRSGSELLLNLNRTLTEPKFWFSGCEIRWTKPKVQFKVQKFAKFPEPAEPGQVSAPKLNEN